MRLPRHVLDAMVLQGVGSFAVLACTILLARAAGPEIQGVFNTLKAEIDLLTALMIVGMPQALFFFLQKKLISSARVLRITLVQSALAMSTVVSFHVWFRPVDVSLAQSLTTSALIGLAVAALLIQGNFRATLLATHSSRSFGFISALPGVLLLGFLLLSISVAPIRLTGSITVFAGVFACAYLIAALMSIAMSLTGQRPDDVSDAARLRALLAYGISNCVPSILQSLCVVYVLYSIRTQLTDAAAVGVFSAALFTLAVGLTPLNYLIPLLFKYWISLSNDSRVRDLGLAVRVAAAVALIVAALAWIFERPVVDGVLGDKYLAYGNIFALLALSFFPQAIGRLLSVLFNSVGRPAVAIIGEAARTATLVTGVYALRHTSVHMMAVVWVLSDFVGLGVNWIVVRWVVSQPARKSEVGDSLVELRRSNS